MAKRRMPGNRELKVRESIWSVSRETKSLYFAVFVALVLISAGLVTYEEVSLNKTDGLLDTVLAAWWGVGRLVLASAAGSLIFTEVWRNGMVLAERLEEWFERRKQRQIAEAVAEAVAETEEKAREKAREETMALWQGWNERRVEAENKGEVFEEPPPSVKHRRPRIVDL